MRSSEAGIVCGRALRAWICMLCVMACVGARAGDLEAEADRMVRQFFEASHAPGVSVSVGWQGRVFWSMGYGLADVEQQVGVDPARTKFRVGSVVKPMTALALASLVGEGRLSIDDDLTRHVPDFPPKDHAFTLGQLAGHLACIRHYAGNESYSRERHASVEEAVGVFRDDPLVCVPGAEWRYSSYGYNLLSLAIERAAGMPFLDYLHATVLAPLGMSATVPDRLEDIVAGRGRYYMQRDGRLHNEPEVDNSNKWASGGMLSTTDDLVRFGLAHVGEGAVPAATRALLWAEQATADGEPTGYGMGWRIVTDDAGDRWIGHGGGSIGGTTQLWLFPEHGLVIAMAGNLTRLDYGDILPRLKALFVDASSP